MCDFRTSPRCKGTFEAQRSGVRRNRARNDGRFICLFCSRASKGSGRKNPNARYAIDDALFSVIETDLHAYLLGWIASDGSITRGTISIYLHKKDVEVVQALRDAFCPELPLKPKPPSLIGFSVSSIGIVANVCRALGLAPGKKSALVRFPPLATDALRWAFIRGFFDGDGCVASLDARTQKHLPTPRCSIASSSSHMLEEIQRFSGIPSHRGRQHIEWAGNNALDFLARLYDNAPIFLRRKRDLYLDWATWVPGLGGPGNHGRELLFRWVACRPGARAPSKAHASDSGFDLTLLEKGHSVGLVQFFRTGVKVQPAPGWYFDLVPRSSISKTGYILANSIGVIDRTYVGEILVPLMKLDPSAPDLPLPARVVQLIPRPIIHAQLVEDTSLDESNRGGGGFGSTGN